MMRECDLCCVMLCRVAWLCHFMLLLYDIALLCWWWYCGMCYHVLYCVVVYARWRVVLRYFIYIISILCYYVIVCVCVCCIALRYHGCDVCVRVLLCVV